jgi:uncharacterized protein YrrD
MFKVELKEGTSVFTSGGEEVGKVNRIVLDPATHEVTHLVVQKGWLFSEDKVVPFEMVNSASEDRVVLNENIENFDELPPFEESHYIRTRDADLSPGERSTSLEEARGDRTIDSDVSRGGRPRYSFAPAYYWYPPHGYVGYPLGYYGWPPMETVRNIPEDTIPLREGTDVMSSDGKHVGDVERLFVEPESSRATHFVISQGVFFPDRKLVPAHWVKSVTEDQVNLAVSADLLESLPAYAPE